MIRLLAILLLLLCMSARALETNWPEFRGPRGDGFCASTNLPLHWGPGQNLSWKTAVHGRGWSSPVIWDGQVWLTTATEDGKGLYAMAIDCLSGKILQDLKVFTVEKPQYCHPFNSYASPTPAIEAGRVYVTFGSAGTACIDTRTGATIWSRQDLECNHFRGAGSSPILYGDWLFLNFDGSDRQYAVALHKRNGQTIWKTERSIDYGDLDLNGKPQMDGDYRKAFATCTAVALDRRTILLSQGSKALYAYDPPSGKELWRVEERSNYSGSTRPVIGHGLIFLPSGFSSGQLLAIRPGREGEVLDAKSNSIPGVQLAIAWKTARNVPKKPSLILLNDLLFGIDDNGTATCWEARSGEVLWSQRIGGNYSASPLASADRIYYFSEKGQTTVVAAQRHFRKLAANELGDGFMASPAVSGNALILRSRTELYRVEQP